MENRRLTTFFIVIFVLVMHGVLIWMVLNPSTQIDNSMPPLTFVDIGKSGDFAPAQGEPAMDKLAHSAVSRPEKAHVKPKQDLSRDKTVIKPQIKAVEKIKPISDHFTVAKMPDTAKFSESAETKPDTQNSASTQNNSNSSESAGNNEKHGDDRDGSLVVPKEYIGGYLAALKPNYPEFSRENGEEGVVVIAVSVTADGSPVNVSVSKSSGFVRLDRAAKLAVQNYRFKPATRGGIAIPYKYRFSVKFTLNKS